MGSGFVAKPTVDVLSQTPDVKVTVACRTLSKAQQLAGKNAEAAVVDVNDDSSLDSAVSKADLVISLIPYIYHPQVIKSAIKHKKNALTTSYTSPAIKELEPQIKEAGITVMNEIGLDPGIDHLYAVKTIEEVHEKKGKINSFLSYCGGLPAAENSDNPLGYKFSWSSRGALLALRNAAHYYKDGKVVDIKPEDLMSTAKPYFIYPGFAFVAYPNRDSTQYKKLYGIPEAQTVIRGNLRYQGFPEFIKVLVDLGFLNDSPVEIFSKQVAWKDAFKELIGAKSSSEKDLTTRVFEASTFKDESEQNRIISGLKWLGLYSDKKIAPKGNPLDTLCSTLEELMLYSEGERDMVVLQHTFGIEWQDGTQETRTSTLVDLGDPKGYSSMAKLVGVPCAVAAQQILSNTLGAKGLVAPMSSKVNNSIMETLKDKYGIYLTEKTVA